MARLVIESFKEFLKSYDPLNEAAGTADAIAMLSASTSSSNIQSGIAKEMGIDPNKSYTFTIDFLNFLYKIGSEKKFDPKVIGEGTKIKSGYDVLEIGGKKIEEKGDFYITKGEYDKDVKITASGNGLLCLARMGSAASELYKTRDITLRKDQIQDSKHGCKDWIMRFSIGGDVKSHGSRGYNLYFAYPGSLNENANLNTVIVAMAMLQFTKYDYLIAKKGSNPSSPDKFDKVIDSNYNSYIKGIKSIGEALQKVLIDQSASLTKRGILVNQSPKLNTESADALIKNAGSYYISGTPSKIINGKPTVALKAEGVKDFKKVLSDMADSLVPVTTEEWGKEAEPVFAQYKSMIKDGLRASNVPEWLGTVQRVTNWGSGSSMVGSSGSISKKQGEGKY